MIGVPASLSPRSSAGLFPAAADLSLPLAAVVLVALPVFVQAPLVRLIPFAAALLTLPLLCGALLLERSGQHARQQLGALLVGFCGSWLAGCLFWGWFRQHPVCHLPIEACLLPLALTGLQGRWRLAASFYLASLAGTAATDGAIAATGLMPLWPAVLAAPLSEAPLLLHDAAALLLDPARLLLLLAIALFLLLISRFLWTRGVCGRIAAATLAATLAVDAIFLSSSLLAPKLSGLI